MDVDTAPFWIPGCVVFVVTFICALINLNAPTNNGMMVCTCTLNSLMAAVTIIYSVIFFIGGIGILAGGGVFAGVLGALSTDGCHAAAVLSMMNGLGVGLIGGSFIYIWATVCCIGAATASCASARAEALLMKDGVGDGVAMFTPDLHDAKAPQGGPRPAMSPGVIVATDKANFTNI